MIARRDQCSGLHFGRFLASPVLHCSGRRNRLASVVPAVRPVASGRAAADPFFDLVR